jgi:hypothetical protein
MYDMTNETICCCNVAVYRMTREAVHCGKWQIAFGSSCRRSSKLARRQRRERLHLEDFADSHFERQSKVSSV